MTKFMTTVCAFAVLGFVAMPALADHHMEKGERGSGKGKAPILKKFDLDGDKKISQKEFMAMHAKKFEKMDTDGDGFLTKEEMKEGNKKMQDEMKKHKEKMKEHKEKMKEHKEKAE